MVENPTKQGKHSRPKTIQWRSWRTDRNRVRRGGLCFADGRSQRLEKVCARRQSRNHEDRSTLFAKGGRSLVYCILGAQAQTRWKIVGQGAKSLQTQESFSKLVKDTIAQDDDKVLIRNMRTAVKSTNVVLNLVVLPGLILIPSDLVLLKEKVPGYNNTLTMAMKEMSFAKNEGLNYDSSLEKHEKTMAYFDAPIIDADKKNKELGVVFVVLALVGAVGAWLW